jgi:hypothetical protein
MSWVRRPRRRALLACFASLRSFTTPLSLISYPGDPSGEFGVSDLAYLLLGYSTPVHFPACDGFTCSLPLA